MNSLSPPIFPDNTEVNGKMKMKCLNVNGDNINEIVTGPKIIYEDGERSFLKSISIDGYRVTVSYIDDLFQGSIIECNLRRDNLNVIYLKLYPNGYTDIRGEAYDSVDKSWKTISFNIAADIQDGYIRREKPLSGESQGLNDNKYVSFDFILPSPSKHTLYSSFITDMKYMSENVEVIKLIDGKGKNDTDLLDIANNNKPCLIISNSPPTTNFAALSHLSGNTNWRYFVTNKMNDNLCTGCKSYQTGGNTLTLFCYINGELSVGGIANETSDLSTLGGCIKFKNRWILAWNSAPYLWITEPNVESPIGATFTGISNSPYSYTNNPQKLTYLDETVAVCSSGEPKSYVNIQNYSVCTDGTTWSEVKTPGISPFKLGNNYYAIGYENGKLYKTTDKYNTLVEIGDTGELYLWLISYANNKAFIHTLYRGALTLQNENVVVVNEDGTFSKTRIDGRTAGGFIFLNGKYLFLDTSSSDVFESTDGINNWTLNPDIKIPQTLGVEQLGSGDEFRWFIMTRSGANEYKYSSYPSSVTMVLNNSTTSDPVFYRAASSVDIPIRTRSIPSSFNETTTELSESNDGTPSGYPEARSLLRRSSGTMSRAESQGLKALNDRVDVLENKLRKFGIE